MSAPKSESPRLSGAATSRFSSTVSRANSEGSWKVRTSPRRARAYAGRRVMSCPSKTSVPSDAGRVPASTARNVDLPAPLGPIRPVIFPVGTSIETPSTACMPSKCLCTAVATSSESLRAAGTAHVLPDRCSLEDAPRFRPHAFRPEPEEPDDEQADRHPLSGRYQVGRRHPAADGWRNQSRHLEEADGHENRTEDRADIVAAPADDDRGEKDDRLGVQPD